MKILEQYTPEKIAFEIARSDPPLPDEVRDILTIAQWIIPRYKMAIEALTQLKTIDQVYGLAGVSIADVLAIAPTFTQRINHEKIVSDMHAIIDTSLWLATTE